MDDRRRTSGKRPAAGASGKQTAATRAAQSSQTRAKPAAQSARKQSSRKKQKVRYHNKNLKYQLLTVVAIVLAIVLCLLIFFRVKHINVTNLGQEQILSQQTEDTQEGSHHAYYTAQDIINVCGIEEGDNLLTISKEVVAARIMAALPYVSEVYIRRVIPNTVNITVSEFDVAYAIADTNGQWWLINREGKVLEKTDEAEAKSHIIIKGLSIVPPEKPGVAIEPEEAEDMAEQNAKKTSLVSILQELETYEYCKQIVTLDLTSSYDIQLWYGTQYQIRIGNTEELSHKMAYLDGVLGKLQSYQTGVIDLTFAEEQAARFQPFS